MVIEVTTPVPEDESSNPRCRVPRFRCHRSGWIIEAWLTTLLCSMKSVVLNETVPCTGKECDGHVSHMTAGIHVSQVQHGFLQSLQLSASESMTATELVAASSAGG